MNTTVNGITIDHPDIGFAFNPISVKLSGLSSSSARLISGGFSIEKEASSGVAFFDLSAIARYMFDSTQFHKVETQDTTLLKNIEFTIKIGTTPIYTGSIDIIWGALQVGETYRQAKTLKMFKGYPFTVPLYLTNGGMLQIQRDGGAFSDFENVLPGKLNIDISNVEANKLVRLLLDSGENFSTFDITFDFTFRGVGVNSVMIDIEVQDTCGEQGTYLRWINKHGEYNYYLFRENSQSSTSSDIDIVFDTLYRTTDYTDHHHIGLGQSVGKEVVQARKLFAHLVDPETFDFLLDLVESPVIDEFTGYDSQGNPLWVSVTVASGTTNKSKAHLQDFELSLVPNKKLIQSL